MMESFFHKTNADTYMLIPTIYGEGPVLTRFEWPQEKINQMVDLEDTQKIDFVVTGAIDEPTPGIWALKIVIWDIINQTVSKTSEYEATAESFGLVVLKAKNDLIEYFASISALKILPSTSTDPIIPSNFSTTGGVIPTTPSILEPSWPPSKR